MEELISYQEKDFEDCVRIYVDAFTAPPLNYDFLTKEKAWRYIRDLARAPGFIGYCYFIQDEMAAFLFGSLDNYFEGAIFEVKELAVASAYHRQGLGTKIMTALESRLAGYNVAAISLQTSRGLPAFNFYQKIGYDEVTENVTLMKWLS